MTPSEITFISTFVLVVNGALYGALWKVLRDLKGDMREVLTRLESDVKEKVSEDVWRERNTLTDTRLKELDSAFWGHTHGSNGKVVIKGGSSKG